MHGVPYIEWDTNEECVDCELDPVEIATIATENAFTNSNDGTIDEIRNGDEIWNGIDIPISNFS